MMLIVFVSFSPLPAVVHVELTAVWQPADVANLGIDYLAGSSSPTAAAS